MSGRAARPEASRPADFQMKSIIDSITHLVVGSSGSALSNRQTDILLVVKQLLADMGLGDSQALMGRMRMRRAEQGQS